MADFEDPAAEFLAREQSALGDLDEDFAFKEEQSAEAKAFSDSSDIRLNGDSNEFDDQQSNGDIVNNGLSNGISDLSLNKSDNQSLPLSQPIIPAEEPESIKKWREQHIKNLEAKDAEEKVKIEELKTHGKSELDEWYTRYSEQLEKAKKQNRSAEKEWIAERDNEAPGQDWEKISRLCDFNPKTSRNTRDTSRMRSMLLQLKQSPPQSSNAAKVST